ncbi:hypothetical protein [Streptomyces sp. NRRL B-24484]|uniref:hypothetical protein n=1 Tax=Streptomyces sp. NRRL B-24484 TaxID=1463833 RepID=UPI0004BF3319|nr:hypothetical protein [Streptomyces sp. NRRL B-24484]
MSSPPDLTEEQLAGIACVDCAAADVPLFDAGTIRRGGGGEPVQILPVMRCRPCEPVGQVIVIASSSGAAR